MIDLIIVDGVIEDCVMTGFDLMHLLVWRIRMVGNFPIWRLFLFIFWFFQKSEIDGQRNKDEYRVLKDESLARILI